MRVLLVEDDPDVARTVRDGLAPLGFRVACAPNGASAGKLLGGGPFDTIILDLALPDGEGLDLLDELRARGDETPTLILTARDSVPERLAGFEHGADDYVGKPFDVNELAARLRVIVRRTKRADAHILHYGDLELNLVTRTVRREALEVRLSDREIELLSFMLRRPEEVLSREYLLEELWGDEVEETSNLVNVYVNLLRNKIEPPPYARLIHTVRGVGYMLSEKEPEQLS